MKTSIALLTILCLALAAGPALAQYENGPINGTVDAWPILDFTASDTFTASPNSTVSGFMFGAWEFPGEVLSSVQWSITSGPNGGTMYGSGTVSGKNLTDTFLSTNQYGFDVDLISATMFSNLSSSTTYWLNLMNASTPQGDPVYWDENSGIGCKSNGCPSQAVESLIGTIPSESFTINAGSGGTPEPSSFLLFGSGIIGFAGVLRCKLWKSN